MSSSLALTWLEKNFHKQYWETILFSKWKAVNRAEAIRPNRLRSSNWATISISIQQWRAFSKNLSLISASPLDSVHPLRLSLSKIDWNFQRGRGTGSRRKQTSSGHTSNRRGYRPPWRVRKRLLMAGLLLKRSSSPIGLCLAVDEFSITCTSWLNVSLGSEQDQTLGLSSVL